MNDIYSEFVRIDVMVSAADLKTAGTCVFCVVLPWKSSIQTWCVRQVVNWVVKNEQQGTCQNVVRYGEGCYSPFKPELKLDWQGLFQPFSHQFAPFEVVCVHFDTSACFYLLTLVYFYAMCVYSTLVCLDLCVCLKSVLMAQLTVSKYWISFHCVISFC